MAQPGYPLWIVTACGVLSSSEALAEWQFGPVISASTDTRSAIESEVQLLPYIAWEGYGFHIGIDEISYESGFRDDITFSISVSDADSLEIEKNDAYPSGINRDSAINVELGVQVGVFPWVLEASVTQDIASTHKGHRIGLGAEISYRAIGGELNIAHSLNYRDQRVMQHRYGVNATDVNDSGLTFTADATTTYGLSVQYVRPMTDSFAWVFQADWEAYPSSHKRSPLVNDTHEYSAVIGWIWSY